MLLTTLFFLALLVQSFLLFSFIILPNIFYTVFIASYGAARLVEKKFASSKISFLPARFLVALLDGNAYLNASLVDLIGRFYHSYTVVGQENIPLDRPALLIYYHGIMPSDMQYLPIRGYLHSGRLIRPYIFPGPASRCVRILANGHLLQISPGGAREAFFATARYETIWNGRSGFARLARETGTDIVPVFTRNIRQMFIIPEWIQPVLRPLYEKVRLPVVPVLGGFPVQLTTFVGKPIRADSADSAEELVLLTRKAIEELIEAHQSLPASIGAAIGERFGACAATGKSHLD